MNFTSQKPVRDNSRSVHPLDKMHTTTGDFFRWDVVHAQLCVQDDVLSFNCKTFIDSAPNPFPINGSMTYGMYAFFVPNRLVWEDWKYYIEDLKPNLQKPYFTLGDLWRVFNDADVSNPWREDYYNDALRFISNINNLSSVLWILHTYHQYTDIPTEIQTFKIDAMPLRMVQRIWWDWMRDKQNISDADEWSYNVKTGGRITLSELVLLCSPKWRCFPKNYITTCFDSPSANPDAGRIAVNLPDSDLNPGLVAISDPSEGGKSVGISADSTQIFKSGFSTSGSNVVGQTSVNDIRYKTSVQQYYERLLVAGKTVLSRALALFGVSPTIEELQMSNYLGGHEEELKFDTSQAGASSYNGDGDATEGSAGVFGLNPRIATVAGQKYQRVTCKDSDGFNMKNINYKTDESGYFFVMGCLIPRVQYYQGLPREWVLGLETFNHDRFDYFHSDMENQPLQPVPNYEVCFQNGIDLKGIYGWTEMYMNFKTCLDSIGGDFINPAAAEGMEDMHLGRDIISLLNEIADHGTGVPSDYLTPTTMIQSSGYDEVFFDKKFTIEQPNLDHFVINHKINLTMNRPMQSHCLPSLDSSLSAMTPKKMVDSGAFRL